MSKEEQVEIVEQYLDLKKILGINYNAAHINSLKVELFAPIQEHVSKRGYLTLGVWLKTLPKDKIILLVGYFNVLRNKDSISAVQVTIEKVLFTLLEVLQAAEGCLNDSVSVKEERLKFLFVMLLCELYSRTNNNLVLNYNRISFESMNQKIIWVKN